MLAILLLTDVVEISNAVVTQATDYFQYDYCSRQQDGRDDALDEDGDDDDDDDETCRNGRTFVMDGLKFVSSTPSQIIGGTTHERPYDLFIVDVYTGWNPFAFVVREKMLQVRENWLTLDGVLVMNFVGYVHGPHAVVPKSIYRTLQSVFKHVKCYREMEEVDERDASNLIFYASDKPFRFNLPTTERYQDAPDHTYFSVRPCFCFCLLRWR